MTLRTPNPYRNYQMQLDITRSKERFAVLAQQISSGKRIVRLGDDPTGVALIMDFQNSIERNKMYVKQGESASSFLKGTETALNSVQYQIDRLLELSEAGLTELTGANGREAFSAEVNTILTTLVDIANTKEQGKFIFAGTNTVLPTGDVPFSLTPTDPTAWTVPNDPTVGVGPGPWPGQTQPVVEYLGNRGNIDLDISNVATVTTNLTGAYVFQGDTGGDPNQDIFIAVAQLRDGLANNDTDLIKQAYDNIREIKNRINVCQTTVGSRMVSIENAGMNLGDFNEALQSIQNTYEAVDYPMAITQFMTEQTAQQAAFSVISKMGRLSLFDYIG